MSNSAFIKSYHWIELGIAERAALFRNSPILGISQHHVIRYYYEMVISADRVSSTINAERKSDTRSETINVAY